MLYSVSTLSTVL